MFGSCFRTQAVILVSAFRSALCLAFWINNRIRLRKVGGMGGGLEGGGRFGGGLIHPIGSLESYISTETIRLIRDGDNGWGWEGYEGRGKGRLLYLSLHCHYQNDSCIKMGSDESQFNVSLIVRDKVTGQCPQTTIFEAKGEPKRIRTEVPLLTSPTPYR